MAEATCHDIEKLPPEPTGPEQITFKPEIIDLVIGIDDPHRPVELEAVDDDNAVIEAYVLGP